MALNVNVRSAFVARLPHVLAALLQQQKPEAPLLLRFNTGLAPHVRELREVLELKQFAPPAIKTGTQNQMAGASGAAPRVGREGGSGTLRRAPRPRRARARRPASPRAAPRGARKATVTLARALPAPARRCETRQ